MGQANSRHFDQYDLNAMVVSILCNSPAITSHSHALTTCPAADGGVCVQRTVLNPSRCTKPRGKKSQPSATRAATTTVCPMEPQDAVTLTWRCHVDGEENLVDVFIGMNHQVLKDRTKFAQIMRGWMRSIAAHLNLPSATVLRFTWSADARTITWFMREMDVGVVTSHVRRAGTVAASRASADGAAPPDMVLAVDWALLVSDCKQPPWQQHSPYAYVPDASYTTGTTTTGESSTGLLSGESSTFTADYQRSSPAMAAYSHAVVDCCHGAAACSLPPSPSSSASCHRRRPAANPKAALHRRNNVLTPCPRIHHNFVVPRSQPPLG